MAEVFIIDDPHFNRGMGGIPDFYNLKITRKGSRRSTPITNILNVGSMHGSQIQQGTQYSTQSGTFNLGIDHTELLSLMTKMRADLPRIQALTAENKAEAETYIDVIEKQLKLYKPNAGFVKSAIESLKTVWEGAASDVVAAVTLGAFRAWLLTHGVSV